MAGGWRVLVPVEILEGQTVVEGVMDLLTMLPVVVLGYRELPEQTPPDQARIQFEDRAQAKLEELSANFAAAGGESETRLVFTNDAEQTIERVATEAGCDAVLLPNPASDVTSILVPIGGTADVDRIADFVAALRGERDIDVALLSIVADEAERADADARLDAAASALGEAGVPESAVSTAVEASDERSEAIADAAGAYGAIVMGESEPSLRSFVFGELSERVAARSLGPVIVVRRQRTETDGEEA